MANTSINSKQSSGAGGLPIPKVNLSGNFNEQVVKVQHSSGTNAYNLYRYPTVTVMDLSDEQIEKGVYVEMLHYRTAKSLRPQFGQSREAAYVVPAPQINGVNPMSGIINGATRGGGYQDLADRPNLYKVTAHGEQIQVWEYLRNRHVFDTLAYTDATGNLSYQQVLVPTLRRRAFNNRSNSTFGYSGRYRPYYFTFRYVMVDEETGYPISGPESARIKLAHKVHPFKRNLQQSGVFGFTVNDIDPLFSVDQMACWFETRLPGTN